MTVVEIHIKISKAAQTVIALEIDRQFMDVGAVIEGSLFPGAPGNHVNCMSQLKNPAGQQVGMTSDAFDVFRRVSTA